MFDFKNLSKQFFNRRVWFKSFSFALLSLSAFAFFLPNDANAQTEKVITKKVVFTKGKSSIVVRGTAQAYTTYAYTLSAKKGQTMNVAVTSRNANVYLTVFEPNALEPVNDPTEEDVSNWSGKLEKSGTYKIMVFSKSDAGASSYTLKISVE